MLEKILKLYVMYMAGDVRSPLPHLVGPPGCGKSTSVEQAAELLKVNLHIINVARLSPLEVEGVQMPVDMDSNPRLHMLTATFWTSLKEGDIILLDEFLRGFPEVYNALLDILTSRRVGSFVLPKVFILGASNSTTAYDAALEDRLLHLPVKDPRNNKATKSNLGGHLIDAVGLYPKMKTSHEMQTLLDVQVLPMFNVLDSFKTAGAPAVLANGKSIRNLIGQARLREVQTPELRELITINNINAMKDGKYQYVVLLDGKNVDPKYIGAMDKLPIDKLTPLQQTNLQLNRQLIETENHRKATAPTEGSETTDDDEDIFG